MTVIEFKILVFQSSFTLKVEIIDKAKKNFQELLYEKSEIFVTGDNLTQSDIQDALHDDPRLVDQCLIRPHCYFALSSQQFVLLVARMITDHAGNLIT